MPLPRNLAMLISEQRRSLMNNSSQTDIESGVDLKNPTGPPKTRSALDYYLEEKSSFSICTFIDNLDVVLKGILRTGVITEFVGLPGSGRTQLCLHLAVSAQVNENSALKEIVYICSNMDFSISRLKEIAECYRKQCIFFNNYDIQDILGNINYVSITSIKEFEAILNNLEQFLENKAVSLVIIDSITFPLRQVDSAAKTSVLYSIIPKLTHIAEVKKFTVVLTNDMTTVRSNEISGSCAVPSLRDTFYHLVNNRVLLSRREQHFQAEIMKSSFKAPMKTEFKFLSINDKLNCMIDDVSNKTKTRYQLTV